MKTIEEASLENSKNHYIMAFSEEIHQYADIDFRKGVEFAQRWIPVKEDKPQEGELVLTKYDNEVDLCWYKNGKFVVKYATEPGLAANFRQKITDVVTHWRPIELK